MKKNLSKTLYQGLTKSQHTENNKWFDLMLRLTNDNGFLTLSNIGVVLQKTACGWVKVNKETANGNV